MNKVTLKNLILVPAVITLAITLLRLTGELMNWSPVLFNRTAGGGGSPIGIIWLVPIFGFYFAHKLMSLNVPPAGAGRVFGFSFLGLAAFAALAALGFSLPVASLGQFASIAAGAMIGILIARQGWPALSSTLLAYGLAARIPVAIIILLAIFGKWGTHYDAPPAGLPDLNPFARWVAIGFIPQFTIWLAVTAIIGSIFGGLAVTVAKRRQISPVAVS